MYLKNYFYHGGIILFDILLIIYHVILSVIDYNVLDVKA